MNQPPTVLRNKTARGNWIRIQLEGTKSNRSAIGSRMTVDAGGRRQMAEVSSGGSYYSQNEFALYFGLGAATKIDAITLRWPNGHSQVFRDVTANRTIVYRE
jgi:enediyne biosynthesis protein E4